MHGVCESVKSLSGISVVAQICSCASYQEKHARDLILESTCPVLSKRILLLLTVRREYLATSPVSIGSEPPMKTMELSRLSPPACAAESRAAAWLQRPLMKEPNHRYHRPPRARRERQRHRRAADQRGELAPLHVLPSVRGVHPTTSVIGMPLPRQSRVHHDRTPHGVSSLVSRFLVASPPVRDLLLCAKHLFFAAMAAIVLAEAQGRASLFGEQI